MEREREEATIPHAVDNSIIDTYSGAESEEEEDEQEELTTEPETAEEYEARMRRERLLEDDEDAQIALLQPTPQAPPPIRPQRTVVDEYDGRLSQSRYERQDTPRPESPEVDEDETERVRQAGVRDTWADWANMHVEHFREGTMTWEELVAVLQRNAPQ